MDAQLDQHYGCSIGSTLWMFSAKNKDPAHNLIVFL
jgi:hypothetical protein